MLTQNPEVADRVRKIYIKYFTCNLFVISASANLVYLINCVKLHYWQNLTLQSGKL
jgi:hypothetical protein